MENTTLKHQLSVKKKRIAEFPYIIDKWTPEDVHELYLLEKKCWAPWLRKPEKDFLTITTNYSDLQRLLRNKNGDIVASMSVNRINWNGKLENLPNWDTIAGGSIETSNFTTTYTQDGNTLCLMSMNVNPSLQGIGLAQKLIEELKNIAVDLKIEHVISSLRPVGYGSYKMKQVQNNQPLTSFKEYCELKNEKNEPYDYWLRSANHQNMKILYISKNAIVVNLPRIKLDEFIKTYNSKKWKKVSDNQWECGEAGSWFADKDHATYREDNLAVEILIKPTQSL